MGRDCLWMQKAGTWFSGDCFKVGSYPVCANPPSIRSGNHILSTNKDLLINPTFHFWWNHTADSIDSGMTGFKLTWHIENGRFLEVGEFASRDLSGKVSTPGLGSPSPPSFNQEGQEYNAVIELPYNITDVLGDASLVVDVTVPEVEAEVGVELLTARRKLEYYKSKLNWTSAEAHCVAKGGHLASFTSPLEWNRLRSVILGKRVTKTYVWVGLTDEQRDGEWVSPDGSKLSSERLNGTFFVADGGGLQNCLAVFTGQLQPNIKAGDRECNSTAHFVCSEPTRRLIKVDSRLVFTSQNISAPALQFNWGKKPTSQEGSAVGGFKIEWHMEGHNVANLSNNKSERFWVQRVCQKGENRNMKTVMNLVRESKINKVSEDLVWKSLLRQRWSREILGRSPCLNESEEQQVIVKAAQELNLATGYNSWVPEEDLAFGFKLYSSIHYCQATPAEAAKLSFFFANILTNHTLKTVISATMQSIQPKAGGMLGDFSAINKWYAQLDRKYNFSSLGHIVASLSSEEQLKRFRELNSPYYVKESNANEGFRLKGRVLTEPSSIIS